MIRRRNQSWLVEVYSPEKGRAVHVKAKDYGLPVPRTRREALDLERLALRANTGPETVGSFAARWVDDFPTGPSGKPRGFSTQQKYREWIRQFATDFEQVPLRAVSREDARSWGLRHPHLVKTVRTMFQDALFDDLVEANPFARMSFEKPKGRKDIDPPTIEQVAVLAAHAGRDEGLVWWLFYTAMRVGEVCAAKWEHLDGNRYSVVEQFNQTERTYTGCKHGSSGVIYVPDAALVGLPPRRLDSPFIFHNSDGGPLLPHALNERWRIIRAAAGLPWVTPHMLRHACATHMLNVLRVDAWKIAKQLRHSDGGRLVLELYGHPDVDVALDDIAAAYQVRPVVVPLRKDEDIAFYAF